MIIPVLQYLCVIYALRWLPDTQMKGFCFSALFFLKNHHKQDIEGAKVKDSLLGTLHSSVIEASTGTAASRGSHL